MGSDSHSTGVSTHYLSIRVIRRSTEVEFEKIFCYWNYVYFANFVRRINSEFYITEKMTSLVPLRDTTKARDLFEAVKITLNTFSLNLINISGLATDGTSVMVGKIEGLAKLSEDHAILVNNKRLMRYHCIVHQNNLFATVLKMDNIM